MILLISVVFIIGLIGFYFLIKGKTFAGRKT